MKQTKNPDVISTMDKVAEAIDRYNNLIDSNGKVFYCPIVAKNKTNEVTYTN